ncbi:hypothetical protein [Paenibacillus sp. y28]|uniref:hypothetical protein n=1 Tax=Paenibacillus sp. y28 TaxID=3129110 RepID=UPI00301624D8
MNGNGETRLESTFSLRAGLVVRFVDRCTMKPPVRDIPQVELEGYPQRAIRKADEGLVLLLKAPRGPVRLHIRSSIYLPETMELDLSAAQDECPTVTVPLTPSPAYPAGAGVTVLRASIRDKDHRPLAGARLRVRPIDEVCMSARLVEDAAKGRDYVKVTGRPGLYEGFPYFFYHKDAKKQELCRIMRLHPEDRGASLANPLAFAQTRGTVLFPEFVVFSNERGEAAVFLPSFRVRCFSVRMEVSLNSLNFVQEVNVEEGAAQFLGNIVLSN